MANRLQSLPGSSGVYFVPKSWCHSVAGCPLQSVVWKESEGEGRVRPEEVAGRGPQEEPNGLGWTSKDHRIQFCDRRGHSRGRSCKTQAKGHEGHETQ